MGGTLGGVFSGQPQGQNNQPSWQQNLAQGILKGVGTQVGWGRQQQPQGGTAMPVQAVQPTAVDPSFFAPMMFPQGGG